MKTRGTVTQPVYVLGMSGFLGNRPTHDAACALLKDGYIVAMAEEERFTRVKHQGGFPYHALQYCLRHAGLSLDQVRAMGIGTDPTRTWQRELRGTLSDAQTWLSPRQLMRVARQSVGWAGRSHRAVIDMLTAHLFARCGANSIPIFCVDHHLAHAASAFYCSGFPEATVISWDGGGDGLSAMILVGQQGRLRVLREFPVTQLNLGIMYKMCSNFLNLSDEGALMGLAAYGTPNGLLNPWIRFESLRMDEELRRSALLYPHNIFGARSRLLRRLGPPRLARQPVTPSHQQLAATVQEAVERLAFRLLQMALRETRVPRLCLAGGVALNATLNGNIRRSGMVEDLFIQPCAGDGGTALGAAFMAYQQLGYAVPAQRLSHVEWGSRFTDEEIGAFLASVAAPAERLNEADLVRVVADELAQGRIVGWMQGAAEWGPRSLGARSLLADPRSLAVRDRLNTIIKHREPWRPFAPSCLREAADDCLEGHGEWPFMIETVPVNAHRRRDIAAVVHVDGTTRPQTVDPETQPRFAKLLQAFGARTGVPVLLNTSFNLQGEPIVNSPADALRCFAASATELLVLGPFVIRKRP